MIKTKRVLAVRDAYTSGTSFVSLPDVVVCHKFKPHIPSIDFYELGNMVVDLLFCLFPGLCLYKGLHNTTTHHKYIKPLTNQPIISPAGMPVER